MRDQRLDALFDRFRRQGDVQALGEIFDAVAPELLRVALSLVRDANEADDLLQETFLTAIERAGRYDASRRLVPWLLGILVHHARERRRRRASAQAVEPREPEAAGGPEAAALGSELEAALERALAELSSRDRRVLEAHLRQGKSAAEIAAEVGAAPGAVRMQIHRGLDRLRKALPAGLALGAAGGALHAQGLAAVRSVVLRAGSQAAPLAAGSAGVAAGLEGMGILMGKKVIVAVGLAALVAGLYVFGGGDKRASSGQGAPVASAAAAPEERESTDRLAPAAAPADPGEGEADEGQREAMTASVLDPDHAELRGRLVEHDGTPVTGTSVALLELDEAQVFPPELDTLRGSATPAIPRLVVASAVTDAQGVFVLPGAAVRALHALGVDLGGERATLRVLDAPCTAGETTDLGDVVLPPTGAVTGRVVDERGQPMSGARVRIGPLSELVLAFGLHEIVAGGAAAELRKSGFNFFLELPPWFSLVESRLPLATTSTDADGRFALGRVAAGHLTAVIDWAGRTPVAARTFELEADARQELGELRLTGGARVQGRVLDARGAPVADAEVRVGSATGPELALLGRIVPTDAEGRFACTGASEEGQRIVFARRGPLCSWVRGAERDGESVVTLDAEQELVVDVVDGSGRPVPSPELLLRSLYGTNDMGPFTPEFRPVAAVAAGEGSGRWSLGRFGAGSYSVLARAEGFAPASGAVKIASGAPDALRLQLSSSRAVSVLVRDASTHEPVAGARVRLESGRSGTPEVLLGAETGSDGRVVIAAPGGTLEPEPWLRVEHPRFAPTDLRLGADASAPTVELTQGARLVARLADGTSERPRMLMLLSRGQHPAHRMPLLVGFSLAGVAEIARLPAGTWNWTVLDSLAGAEALLFLDPSRSPEEQASGEVTLVEGQTSELAIHASTPQVAVDVGDGDAVVAGSVQLDGRAAPALDINLCSLGEGGDTRYLKVPAGGRFRFEGVTPGRYLLLVDTEPSPIDDSTEVSLVQEDFELASGEQRDLDYDLHLAYLAVRALAADGETPVAGAGFRLTPEEGGFEIQCGVTSKANGRASIAVTRTGRFLLNVTHPEQGVGQAHVEIGGDGDGDEVVIRLTKGVECAGTLRLGPGFPELDETSSSASLYVQSTKDEMLMKDCEVELEDGAGTFRLVGMEPGEYTIVLWVGGQPSIKQTLVLPEWGSSTLDFELLPNKQRAPKR